MPTKYRAVLQDMSMSKCVVTIDTDDDCLLLYPLAVWEEIESKLQALPSLNPRVRRVQRLLIGHASEVDLDSQGRLLLPNILRDHAAVDKKLMLVGQGKKFEIWSESNWQSHRQLWLETGKAMRDSQEEVPSELSDISV